MAGPRGQELGIKSPLNLRAGITFPGWAGINKENDPGAIQDNQFFYAQNVRIDGNEISSRGGQEKIHDVAMTGCVAGFIDLPDSNTFVWGSNIGVYSAEQGTQKFLLLSTLPKQSVSQSQSTGAEARRTLARYNGKLFTFGSDGIFYNIVIPPRSLPFDVNYAAAIKAEKVIEFPEFSSYAFREELLDNGTVVLVLYVGSVSLGEVYRFDGSSFSEETSNLGATRHIMVNALEDIWAIGGDEIRKRNGGSWTLITTLPDATVIPNAAAAFQNEIIIAGDASGVGKLYRFDGATVTETHIPTDTPHTAISVADVSYFGSAVYFSWKRSGAQSTVYLGKWDGTAWDDEVIQPASESSGIGSIDNDGTKLYWSVSLDGVVHLIVMELDETFELIEQTPDQIGSADVVVF